MEPELRPQVPTQRLPVEVGLDEAEGEEEKVEEPVQQSKEGVVAEEEVAIDPDGPRKSNLEPEGPDSEEEVEDKAED